MVEIQEGLVNVKRNRGLRNQEAKRLAQDRETWSMTCKSYVGQKHKITWAVATEHKQRNQEIDLICC